MAAFLVANEHLWAVLNMLHAHATVTLCYEQLELHEQG